MSEPGPPPLGAREPPLGERELHVWSLSLGDVPRGQRLPRARERRAAVLAGYLGVGVDEVRIEVAPGGKPVLAGGALQFSLTHSGTLAMLAVSRSLPVGIDLDRPRRADGRRRGVDLRMAIRDRCSDREGAFVRSAADPQDAWTRLWTRKEAVVKAAGVGVLDQLASVDVLEDRVVVLDGMLEGAWRCLDMAPPAEGFCAAVAFPDVADVRVLARR